jgi:hypothetical protein
MAFYEKLIWNPGRVLDRIPPPSYLESVSPPPHTPYPISVPMSPTSNTRSRSHTVKVSHGRMVTRSMTQPPRADVHMDFDEASRAWRQNKVSLNHGCFAYLQETPATRPRRQRRVPARYLS